MNNTALYLVSLALLAGTVMHNNSPHSSINVATRPDRMEEDIAKQVNIYRQSYGIPPLRLSRELSAIAKTHSQNMAREQNLSHNNWSNRSRQIINLGADGAAENVASNWNNPDPVATAMSGWKNSRGHDLNMKNRNYNATGVGAVKAQDGTYYFTQIFASFP